MKKHCIDCIYITPKGCAKNKKNGYLNCVTFRAIPIDTLIKERNKLLLSGDNPERLAYLTEKLTTLNGGIV